MDQSLVKKIGVLSAGAIIVLSSVCAEAAGKITAKLGAVDEPIIIPTHNWSPNFSAVLYGGAFVEFREFDPACKTDASWGVNPNMFNDWGGPAGGYMKKVVWDGMPRKWPAAYKVLTRINFTSTMSKLVDIDGME